MSTTFAGNMKKSIAILAAFALTAALAVISLFNSQSAFATTTSVDVYLDGILQGTISSADITTGYETFNYSTTDYDGITTYRTAYGKKLTSLLDDLSITTSSIKWVYVYSPFGALNQFWFSQPQTQLFAARYAFLPSVTIDVDASLSYNSGRTGGQLSSAYGIQLMFGQNTPGEKNLIYCLGEISRIDLFTSTPSPVPTSYVYPYIEYEPNDSFETAISIHTGTVYESTIESSADIDWYKYVSEGAMDRIELTLPADRNYDVFAYDQNQNLLASGVRTGLGESEKVTYRTAPGQTYYIKIVGANGQHSFLPYSFKVTSMSLKWKYNYDSRGRLTSITDDMSNETIATYLYDENGNLKKIEQ